MPSPAPFRALVPEDVVESPCAACLGRQLQLLIASGDLEFVNGIAWHVNARVLWLLEPTDDDARMS
jgi:hypothetical protein